MRDLLLRKHYLTLWSYQDLISSNQFVLFNNTTLRELGSIEKGEICYHIKEITKQLCPCGEHIVLDYNNIIYIPRWIENTSTVDGVPVYLQKYSTITWTFDKICIYPV